MRVTFALLSVAASVDACATFSSASDASDAGALAADAGGDGGEEADVDGDIVYDGDAKRVFVTSATFGAALGSAGEWDSKCQAAADSKNLGGTWVAWLSSSASLAVDRLQPATPYVRLDRVLVADGGAQLLGGTLAAAIAVDETNQLLDDNIAVWTGTRPDGGAATDTCLEWTTTDAGATGRYGIHTAKKQSWTSNGATGCNVNAHLYCFEK